MSERSAEAEQRMKTIVSLCKRRGFVFQSSEIYGGLKSAYDYGPLGVELKRNLMAEWWRSMVHSRADVVGLDASIVMHTRVWEASGHLAGFKDPLVDCLVCKERFRADKAPTLEPGAEAPMEFADKGRAKAALVVVEGLGHTLQRRGKTVVGAVGNDRGYVCPNCGSPLLSEERAFNLMFRSSIGPVDPLGDIAAFIEQGDLPTGTELRKALEEITGRSAVYLRPETAQAMFVQFQNIQQTMSLKLPFGIAQMGKSFRNEITTEHFTFRSCEFEQMEMEFFCEPGTDDQWLEYWTQERMQWWQQFLNHPEDLRLRAHEPEELAHYARACYDIEYRYPWGWDELEGVANRTDYDLAKHQAESGVKLSYFDQSKTDPETGKQGHRFLPYVIEPAAGATRGMLMYLLDAYHEEEAPTAKGGTETRVVLKLHPRLAPFKCAVLPLVKKDGMPEIADEIVQQLLAAGINSRMDAQHAIGKRYRRHDEAGTPFCLTVDGQTLQDRTITIRDRDTMEQERISVDDAVERVRERVWGA